MQTPNQEKNPSSQPQTDPVDLPLRASLLWRRYAIAYSLDTLIPGLYIWLGVFKLRLGGSLPEDNYRGTVHNPIGLALVLPGYQIYSTYQGSYAP